MYIIYVDKMIIYIYIHDIIIISIVSIYNIITLDILI